MFLWPHQLQKTNDKKSNLCCMKKRDCSTETLSLSLELSVGLTMYQFVRYRGDLCRLFSLFFFCLAWLENLVRYTNVYVFYTHCSTDANMKTVRANFLSRLHRTWVWWTRTKKRKLNRFSVQNLETIVWKKKKKKKKEKRKWKNEFVLHELTKTVLKLHSTKWSAKSWGALIQGLCEYGGHGPRKGSSIDSQCKI